MTQDTAPASKAASPVWPAGKKPAFFVLAVVALLGAIDYFDRMSINSLLPFIKEEFALTDSQCGLITGVANFGLAMLTLPAAYFIDKWSRKKMICIMGLIWSAASGACAFASGLWQFVVLRFFCGSAEAGYTPAGQTLMSTFFPAKYLSSAIGGQVFLQTLGSVAGVVTAAYIATAYGWHHALGIMAIPGAVIALLALKLKDFKNIPVPSAAPGAANAVPPSFFDILKSIISTRTLVLVILVQTLSLLAMQARGAFTVMYFVREGGLSPVEAAAFSSMVGVTAIPLACISGPIIGMLTARFGLKNVLSIQGALLIASFLILCITFGPCTPGSILQVSLLIAATCCSMPMSILACTAVSALSPARIRGSALSTMILMQNIFGFFLGPWLCGQISDFSGSLAFAQIAVAAALAVGGILLCTAIRLTYENDAAKASDVSVSF